MHDTDLTLHSSRGRLLSAIAVLLLAVFAAALVTVPVQVVPYVLAAIGIGAVFALWSTAGSLMVAALIWFVLVIAFDEQFWRASVPFFFNVTLSRIGIVVVSLLWLGMWLAGRVRLRWSGAAMGWMLAGLVYYTLSAAISGFKTASVATVHYRLIGGYWFAFAMFFVLLHAVRAERDIRLLLWFFVGIGLYLALTGWCEHLHFWSLVFPRYIADPAVGIHWGRVRGPFVVSPSMGVALLFCFFAAMVLARQMRGPGRVIVYGIAVAMLPPIFWTQTRSVWLGLLLAGAVWIARSPHVRSRVALVALLIAMSLVVTTVNFENFASTERSRGGVAEVDPIYVRIGLAMITWEMFKDDPLVGCGFGHFRDVAPMHARDVSSPYLAFASPAMEHNNFLSLLAETGLIGLILYVGLLVVLARMSFRLYRVLPATAAGPISRDLVLLYWALFVVYLCDAMFRETSVHPFTNSLFFGISGMMAAVCWLLQPSGAAKARSPFPSIMASRTVDAAIEPAVSASDARA